MKTNHSEGEWKVGNIEDGEQYEIYCDGHLICKSATLIPDVEIDANLKLMAAAPDLLEAIQKAVSISDLWTFDKDVTIEHEDEAKALYNMKLEFDRLIKKATE